MSEGRKADAGKLPYDLLPSDAIEEILEVLKYGAAKYEPRNWEKGMKYSNVIASLDRHWNDFKAGVERDPETGCLHITHVVWNAMALLTFKLRGIGIDDRQKIKMPRQVKNG